ncbi:hypothetical protein [Colwellia psychrerythraea]|uniref:Uncharacterized protein n=1 Tax=Colwellia psychrerythraea TaxID=28229 RepID=A0A099KFE5_COLPS|nr:hypothetical protein [Colwellia psychrerythraea]KGJ88348.1 hypothetical protein ND2E_4184 [Colwellia psychrerythraea]
MNHSLKNKEYDDQNFLVKQIAKESQLFNSYIQETLKDVDTDCPTRGFAPIPSKSALRI